MKKDLFSSIMRQDIEFFDNHKSGEIVSRLTSDVQEFKSSFKHVVSQGLRSFTQVLLKSFFPHQYSRSLSALSDAWFCCCFVSNIPRHDWNDDGCRAKRYIRWHCHWFDASKAFQNGSSSKCQSLRSGRGGYH